MAEKAGSNHGSSLELREYLENMPQELYDRIYDLTFTADAKIRIFVPKPAMQLYKLEDLVVKYPDRVGLINEPLSHLLWVDRRSRKRFLSSFLTGGSVFVFYDSIVQPLSDLVYSGGKLVGDVRIVLPNEWSLWSQTDEYKEFIKIFGIDREMVLGLLEERGGATDEDDEQ